LLVALLFRLGVERRASQIGLLLALGFTPAQVARSLLTEAAIVAAGGVIVGLVGAAGYAWLMLKGLQTWWADAVHAPFLTLHLTPQSILIGGAASLLVAFISMTIAIRGLTRCSTRALLAGIVASGRHSTSSKQRSAPRLLAASGTTAALALVACHAITGKPSETIAFFGSGSLTFIAALSFAVLSLSRDRAGTIHRPGMTALTRLGAANAVRHRGRSLLSIALIASATFLITSLQTFRIIPADTSARDSSAGGYELFAEAAIPLPFNLNSAEGREKLGVEAKDEPLFQDIVATPFRLRSGDETSCLNLYKPSQPRILGATSRAIQRGGFAFADSLAQTDPQRQNPWLLLDQPHADGAIPVIGDEAAVRWQLHLGLGKDLMIQDERGQAAPLRFVALLRGSVLQSEIIMAESAFTRLFPSITGHGFFLIDTPQGGNPSDVSLALEHDLEHYGFDANSTLVRLRDYAAVQNTYLSTFQTLGGLGLALGTLGLAAVLLRNAWERRAELALMRALGFSSRAIAITVLSENVLLVLMGLLAGFLPALIAVAPHLGSQSAPISWSSWLLTLLVVTGVGIGASAVVLFPVLRANLIQGLRGE